VGGDAHLVLVNRGFINGRMDVVKSVLEKQKSKDVTIEGVLRDPRQQRYFMPDNQYDKRVWMYEDLATLEKELSKPVLPLVIEETTACKDCSMIRSDGRVRLRNDHLGYAITWFSLTFIGLVMFAIYHRKKTDD
jgi:surfeit locus 1 family protein